MCSLAHLDRPYDYLVAEPDSAAAQPGTRVRVRFAGRLVAGYVVARIAESDHRRTAGLPRAGGVGRAGAGARDRRAGQGGRRPVRGFDGRRAAVGGPAAARQDRGGDLRESDTSRAVPRSCPDRRRADPGRPDGDDAPGRRLAAVPGRAGVPRRDRARGARPARSGRRCRGRTGRPGWPRRPESRPTPGRGALLIVPDARDLARLDAALSAALGAGAARQPVRRPRPGGAVPPVPGCQPRPDQRWLPAPGRPCSPRSPTSAVVAVFDDGDDLLAEPRAPYPHAREVLMLRSAAHVLRPAGRWFRPHRRGPAAGREWLGAADCRGPQPRSGRRAADRGGGRRLRDRR